MRKQVLQGCIGGLCFTPHACLKLTSPYSCVFQPLFPVQLPCSIGRPAWGDHFLPVSDHFLGRWMSVGVQVFRGCRVVLGGAVSGLG